MSAETNAQLVERMDSLTEEVRRLRSKLDEIKNCPNCDQLFMPRNEEGSCYMCSRNLCHSQMR